MLIAELKEIDSIFSFSVYFFAVNQSINLQISFWLKGFDPHSFCFLIHGRCMCQSTHTKLYNLLLSSLFCFMFLTCYFGVEVYVLMPLPFLQLHLHGFLSAIHRCLVCKMWQKKPLCLLQSHIFAAPI